jgi:hypothetical protein
VHHLQAKTVQYGEEKEKAEKERTEKEQKTTSVQQKAAPMQQGASLSVGAWAPPFVLS